MERKDIPTDFDWKFYLKNHKDLIDAGLKTEEDAIVHYLNYGIKENRDISNKLHRDYYEHLKVYNYDNKIRIGNEFDGGYVIANIDNYDCYISAGVGDDESFSSNLIDFFKLENCWSFDGTINDLPENFPKKLKFIRKNISSTIDDFKTNLLEFIEYENIFLKMDIEGGELDWFDFIDDNFLCKIKQMVIEFHDLEIENKRIIEILKKINKTHYLIHVHGNNNDKVEKLIPNVIELTFIRKEFIENIELNKKSLPSILDKPNRLDLPDIDLNYEPFVFNL